MNKYLRKIFKRKDKPDVYVKVKSAEIVVHGTQERPYFEIKYKEVGKNHFNIGYSSYDLNTVFGYMEEYFKIVKESE